MLAVLVALVVIGARGLCQFLAVTNRANGQLLVVEGWVPAYACREAVAEFRKGGYHRILAAGTIQDDGESDETRVADQIFAEGTLIRQGAPRDALVPVPCRATQRDRTFHSALSVKAWLQQHEWRVASIDVITVGPHARRSRLLYQKALGSEVQIGVIAVEDPNFDPRHWWCSSEGVREVVGETVAYLYAKFLFSP